MVWGALGLVAEGLEKGFPRGKGASDRERGEVRASKLEAGRARPFPGGLYGFAGESLVPRPWGGSKAQDGAMR